MCRKINNPSLLMYAWYVQLETTMTLYDSVAGTSKMSG